jgi:hypothetical protein
MRWTFVSILAFVAISLAPMTRADIVTHFSNPAARPQVGALLDTVGIGSGNSGSETTATTFFVPGAGTTNLTFTFQPETGSFLFDFGFYPISAVSANPVTQKQLYATQAITAGTLVFSDLTQDPGATSGPHALAGGTELGFWLIPNNTRANFLASPGSFFPSQTTNNLLRSPMFSVTDANPGELDQMLSFAANNVTLFTWEDLTRTGTSDQNFHDLAFTINAALQPGQGGVVPEASSILIWSLLGVVGGYGAWRRRRSPVRS